MSELEIVVRRDGVETNVTEAVQVMYDLVHSSMDWGSGFFDSDEVAAVAAFAEVAGFDPLDAINSFGYGPRTQQNAVRAEIITKAKDIRALFSSLPVVRP